MQPNIVPNNAVKTLKTHTFLEHFEIRFRLTKYKFDNTTSRSYSHAGKEQTKCYNTLRCPICTRSIASCTTHSSRRSNVLGDARFWFCTNLVKFAQYFCANFALNLPKSNQIWPKIYLLGDAAACGCCSSYGTGTAYNAALFEIAYQLQIQFRCYLVDWW